MTIEASPSPQLLLLSADTQEGLAQERVGLQERLLQSQTNLSAFASALQFAQKDAVERWMLVCRDRDDALAALAEQRSNRIITGRVENSHRPLALLLGGIGDHYVGMGYGLYNTRVVFKEEVDRCARILMDHLGVDIRNVLYPPGDAWKRSASGPGIDLKKMLGQTTDEPQDADSARLNTTFFAQPALFTIEYAMARLWLSLGVTPHALLGHSMGEYVAACLAGVFSLGDGLRLIATRAKLVTELPKAVMLAVMMPEGELRAVLPDDLDVSLINGPSHCVVAGAPKPMTEFEKTLAAQGVICRRVQNGHAFHTKQMEPIFKPFLAELAAVKFREPTIPFLSNVTGDWITQSQATDPDYWLMHAGRTARVNDALGRLWRLDSPILVECGPGRTLTMLAVQHPDRKATLQSAIWSIRQRYENEPDEQVLQKAIGKVWLSGFPILRSRIQPDSACEPTSAISRFEEQMHSAPPPKGDDAKSTEPAPAGLPGTGAPDSDDPATPREQQLVEVWRGALGCQYVGVNDSFGALGGDSLSSIAAIMEMHRVGVPDSVARGLYRGLTIRQMALQEVESSSNRAETLSSVETAVLVRALAIYIVVAGHFGISDWIGNTSLMVVSGSSFAKFQVRAIGKSGNIRPVLRLMLKLAIPCFLFTVLHQAVHGVAQVKSWFFIDNWLDPAPFEKFESPYFIDLLLQTWLLAALPLAFASVRRFAFTKPFWYAVGLLGTAWLGSVVIPLMWDPTRTWRAVPYMYLWLFAVGWCAAQSVTKMQRLVTSVALVALNAIDYYCQVGLPVFWYVVLAGLAITWFDEVPARLPRTLVEIIIGAAAASLFIYLTHFQFRELLQLVLSPVGIAPPPLASVVAGMLGGFIVWKGWNRLTQFVMVLVSKASGRSVDLHLSERDV